MKKTKFKRLMSALLSAAMLFTLCVPGMSATETQPSASPNLLGNPGFEDGAPSETATPGHWGKWKNVSLDTEHTHNNSGHALKVAAGDKEGSSSEQFVTGLTVGDTYTFTIWAKLNNELAENAKAPEIGAKCVKINDQNKKEVLGEEVKVPVTSTDWTKYEAEFVHQGGDACVFVWVDPKVANDIVIYADDASLTRKDNGTSPEVPDVPEVSVSENLLVDSGFETKDLGPGANSEVGHWNKYGYTRQQDMVHDGEWAVKSPSKTESTICTRVDGLMPGTTYELSAFVRSTEHDKGNAVPRLGAKQYDGGQAESRIDMKFNSTEWTENKMQFVYTAGTPEVYIWTDYNNSNMSLYVDDMELRAVKGISAVDFKNGEITVQVVGHKGELSLSDFSATYTMPDGEEQALELTAENASADRITLKFTPILGAAVDQQASVTLSYGADSAKQQITGSFLVKQDQSKVVVAQMESAEITNGTATVVLDKVPNPLPAKGDFQVSYTVDNGDAQTAEISSLTFNKDTRTVEIKFAPVEGSAQAARNVVISVTYGENTIDSKTIVIDKLTARTFYVAADGSDENDGLTPETPFRTIDKINTLKLIPGDKVLFKKGDTFQGALKPKGSGAEGAPIVIASYGEGNVKPILEAKGTWEGEIQKAGGGSTTPVERAVYRGTIWLENIEYYEVRDLELVDRDYDANNLRVNEIPYYSAGIRVVNKNMGDLHHYVFDNLTIHGFRAMGSNFGKSGGAIQFNVLVDSRYPTDPTKNVPSAMHDISVTNCEMYECGRSGINFLNPWGKRIGDKWPGSQEGVLPWHAFTNFYMANNVIHHIDGDALITDTVANAVVEKNLCYETAIHLGQMGAAVGFFNWNSDDNYFQYNEVFNIGKNASKQDGRGEPYYVVPGDAQGIEIDALNDRSFVQYNYVHDNYGGFMMWCNLASYYPSYDGVVRYNISENDHMQVHGIFDIFPEMYGSETYNNVFYMNPETALKNGKLKLYNNNTTATKDDHLVYNNIFYLTGDKSYPVETWGNTKIDWQSNIFCNIQDAPGGSNMTVTPDEPIFVDPGKGYDPAKPVTQYRGLEQMRKDLEGYKLVDNSIAIDAGQWCPSMEKGIPVGMTGETIPMHDFFGKPVTGIPDIGVHETDAVTMNIISKGHTVNQQDSTITVNSGTTVEALMDSLIYGDGLEVSVLRGQGQPDEKGYLLEGDILHTAMNGESRDYTIIIAAQADSNVIPVDQLTAVAGSEEKRQGQDLASNVLTGNGIWHTAWNGSERNEQWIYLKINDDAPAYRVTGMTFLPRQDNSPNGVITSYKLLGSNDGNDWTEITEGTWALNDRSLKTINFDESAQNYTYYKLQVVDAASNSSTKFASMAQIRLLGHEISAETPPTAPANVKVENITDTTAAIRWDVQENSAVTFTIHDASGTVLACVPADVNQVTLAGLNKGETYTGLTVTAENALGVTSTPSTVPSFTTTGEKAPVVSFPDVNEDDWFYEGAMYSASKGYITGLPGGIFGPDVTMTRAQLIQMLYAVADKPEVNTITDKFDDVLGSEWYAKAVTWAVEAGITTGVAEGKFAPNAEITRQEMAVMLRAFKDGKTVESKVDFIDNADIADWAVEAVQWAAANKLMSSTSTDAMVFSPKSTATRAEAAAIMMNLDQLAK